MQYVRDNGFSYDGFHHLVHTEKALPFTELCHAKNVFAGMVLFPPISLYFITHTSTDFEDIFTDHVTLCILSEFWNLLLCPGKSG